MRLAEPGGGRASEVGAAFTRLRMLPAAEAGTEPDGVILAEGETDAARLLALYPTHAVAVLPAGAKPPTDVTAAQVSSYPVVRVALDDDAAGNEASARWLERCPHAVRMKPPGNDWCSSDEPPDGWASLLAAPARRVFSIRDLLDADLGTTGENNWFADGILPMAGFQIVHASPKSLKSFLILEEARALVTGTAFAGRYPFTRPHPARVLLYQYEIPPAAFQDRVRSLLLDVPREQLDAFLDNFYVRGLANNTRPRLKIGKGLVDDVRRDVDDVEADVVIFDPFQKMTGGASLNDGHDLEPLFDAVDVLRSEDGLTVIGLHHNNKADRNARDPLAMSGTQRFAADPDSIVSLTTPQGHDMYDDGPVKARNFGFELRNGVAPPSSITVAARVDDPDLVTVTYGPIIHREDDPKDPKPAGPDLY